MYFFSIINNINLIIFELIECKCFEKISLWNFVWLAMLRYVTNHFLSFDQQELN